MTVLMLINRLAHGGAERSLVELLPFYARDGVHPIVATLAPAPNDLERDVIDAGFDVHVVRGRQFAFRSRDVRGLISAVRDLRRLIRNVKPDLVHTNLFAADIAGRLAAARLPVATLTSIVGNTYAPERLDDPNVTAMNLRACRIIDKWTGRAVNDHFHAISHAVKESAQAALKIPDDRITVIHRGRDGVRLGRGSAERRAAARHALGIEPDAEVIISVAKQEHRKGLGTLIDAVARLAPRRAGLVMIHAGLEGHATDELQHQIEKDGLGDRVHMLGYRSDVPELLAAADVFVFPSLYEGLGGSVIEAMALGLPIIASDTPALQEMLEPDRNALLVPPLRAPELADAINQLLDDSARRLTFAARSREIFEERFTVERSAARMLDLYTRVVDEHHAKQSAKQRRRRALS